MLEVLRVVRVPLGAFLLLAGLALAGEDPERAGRDGAKEPLREAVVVQVLHREARTPEGTLVPGSRREAADEAAFVLSGESFLVDAWAGVAGEDPLTLLVLPGAEALANAVEDRIVALLGAGSVRARVSELAALEDGADVLVLAAPFWQAGRTSVDLEESARAVEKATGQAPRAFLVDLFETRIGEEQWDADALLGARKGAAAALVTAYTLESRAAGRVVSLDALFSRHGIDRETVRWYRPVLPLPE